LKISKDKPEMIKKTAKVKKKQELKRTNSNIR